MIYIQTIKDINNPIIYHYFSLDNKLLNSIPNNLIIFEIHREIFHLYKS